ncbi:MAG: L-seryl-tRNA(Sec) selenium transferase [Acidobacteriota bacterium]
MTLRDLPSVHELVAQLDLDSACLPHAQATDAVRGVLDEARRRLLRGEELPEPVLKTAMDLLAAWQRPSLRSVVNATGVVLHTNLGRAPLAPPAQALGYSNLEYDLGTGKRGRRDIHTAALLQAILGRPAIVVNNNAAALFLVLNELAAGGEVIVSRGEMIEIGEGFRIPDIMQRSGAQLREIGTTNRTHIGDYRGAINERTRLLLRVHRSNFRMTGFTARPELGELVALGRERGIPVYEDLGSGCVVDLSAQGIQEPLAQSSLAAGVHLISFSGDKLLGGPQAGIIAGDAELVGRVRRNPLFRAFRQDKLVYQALEATLRHILFGEYDSVPALRMIRMNAPQIRERAEALAARLGPRASVEAGESVIGGGSTPDIALPTWLIAITHEKAAELERRLRANEPPIIARIEHDRVLLDLRTVFPEQENAIVQALS